MALHPFCFFLEYINGGKRGGYRLKMQPVFYLKIRMRFNLWEILTGLRARCIARWEKQWWLANFQIYLPKTNGSPLPLFFQPWAYYFPKYKETKERLSTDFGLHSSYIPYSLRMIEFLMIQFSGGSIRNHFAKAWLWRTESLNPNQFPFYIFLNQGI